MPLLDDLRNAVNRDGRSHAEICRAIDFHPKTFSAFMHGRRGLSPETFEKLVAALGLTIRLVKKRGKR